MFWCMFVSLYYVLSHSTLLVAGQCTVSSCALSVSGSEEGILESLEENYHRLDRLIKNMCSASEKADGHGHDEIFERVYRNMSNWFAISNVRLVRVVDEKFKLMNEELSSKLRLMDESVVGAWKDHDQKLQTMNRTLSSAMQLLTKNFESMHRNLSYTVQTAIDSLLIVLDEKFQSMNERLYSRLELKNGSDGELNATLVHVNKDLTNDVKSQDYCQNATSTVCDCSDIKSGGHTRSGVYRIYVVDQGKRYNATAYCDMTTDNSSWTVFQRRKDGSENFYRDWNDYANGFGNPNGEFWLGNDFLHLLTSKRSYRLRFDLEDFEGERRYAEYSAFNVSSCAEKYRLKIGNYSGDAGNSFIYQDDQPFSTKDSDNDGYSRHCARVYRGAWWYQSNDCHLSNLNGLYLGKCYPRKSSFNGWEGILWCRWHYQWYSLKTTEMKISFS